MSQIPDAAACVSFDGWGIGAWWNWLPWTFDHRTAGEGWPQCHSDQPRLSLLGYFPAASTTHHSLEANWQQPRATFGSMAGLVYLLSDTLMLYWYCFYLLLILYGSFLIECDCLFNCWKSASSWAAGVIERWHGIMVVGSCHSPVWSTAASWWIATRRLWLQRIRFQDACIRELWNVVKTIFQDHFRHWT